ncbi:MAG: hypothetical protein IJ424_01535 [Oscillospiraceae bacterium]|nr:hypothetical protein [Oscillospiraceae bacterium]
MANSESKYKSQLKNKYKEFGLKSLSPREILELVLFYSMPSATALECADALLERFGSINGILTASFDSLLEVHKMTEKAAAFIKLIPSMCVQYTKSCTENGALMQMSQIRDFFNAQFYGLDREVVKIVCLDKKLQILNVCTVAGGEASSVMINARQLISQVISSDCVGCIMGHNHPQGKCEPSQEDIAITKGITALLNTVKVELFDHIIVGNDGVWSLKAGGKI